MNNRSEEYFQVLGSNLGVEIRPNEDGTNLITVDGNFAVIMRGNDVAGRMELSAAIADELPESVSYSDMLDLMSLALGPLFDAPGIGREPESGAIVMYALFPFDTISPADFAEAVPQFLDRARRLSDHFAAMSDDV